MVRRGDTVVAQLDGARLGQMPTDDAVTDLAVRWLGHETWSTRIGIGTYRSGSGALVHVREQADGQVVVEWEPVGAAPALEVAVAWDLVKLSDDPRWPDVPVMYALGAQVFD